MAPGVFAGVAVSYTHSNVNEHSTSSGTVDTGRVMAYSGGLVGSALWGATIGDNAAMQGPRKPFSVFAIK